LVGPVLNLLAAVEIEGAFAFPGFDVETSVQTGSRSRLAPPGG